MTGLDPRNCATPDRPGTQPSGLLMLREIKTGVTGAANAAGAGDGADRDAAARVAASASLGDIFWASEIPPAILGPAAATNGIKTPKQMDAATQADLQVLVGSGGGRGGGGAMFKPPCDVAAGSGTLKCEGCNGECQEYDAPGTKGLGLANERTHYPVPNGAEDVILFRAHSQTLWASIRMNRCVRFWKTE